MGTFASTIHVYTRESIPTSLGSFRCFSDGWQTMLPVEKAIIDFESDKKLARKLSKELPYPILYFWEYDSDEFGFVLFCSGKQVTIFGTDPYTEAKGLFKLPEYIGYPEGNKRRLSRILSCADMEYSIAMLEEYFGVCLEVFFDLLDMPQDLIRTRSDEKYRAYLEEERRFTGKDAGIYVELTEEVFGKLEDNPVFGDFSRPKQHIFYLAQFHTLAERCSPLPAVEFRHGKLMPADGSVIQKAKIKEYDDPRFHVEFYPRTTVTFSDLSPAPYRSKCFTALPRGYYPYDFDESDHLILQNERGDIAFMNSNGELIAKCRIKGCLMDYRDGFFLTDKDGCFDPHGWGFDPEGVLRIYRIVERSR